MLNEKTVLQTRRQDLYALQCMILPTRERYCPRKYWQYQQKAYQFWRAVRQQELQQIFEAGMMNQDEIDSKSVSDDFLLQEEAITLFYKQNPVGMIMLDSCDLRDQAIRNSAYMKICPDRVIQNLIENGNIRAKLIRYCIVHPDWRRKAIGRGISEIIFCIAAKQLLASQDDLILGYSRNDRSAHLLFYHIGGQPIYKDLTAFGGESEIIAIYRKNICSSDIAGVPELVDYLWDNRISFEPHTIQQLQKEF